MRCGTDVSDSAPHDPSRRHRIGRDHTLQPHRQMPSFLGRRRGTLRRRDGLPASRRERNHVRSKTVVPPFTRRVSEFTSRHLKRAKVLPVHGGQLASYTPLISRTDNGSPPGVVLPPTTYFRVQECAQIENWSPNNGKAEHDGSLAGFTVRRAAEFPFKTVPQLARVIFLYRVDPYNHYRNNTKFEVGRKVASDDAGVVAAKPKGPADQLI